MSDQEVNLYLPMFRKVTPMFSAQTILQLVSVAFVLLAGIYGYGKYENGKLQDNLERMQVRVANVQTKLDSLRTTSVPEASEDLEKQRVELTATLDKSELMLGLLAQSGLLGRQDFATKLETLGNKHIDGIWLTEIHFQAGGDQVSLAGWTQRAEMVPQYLNRISRVKEFEGVKFGTMKIERELDESHEAFKFHIGTRKSDSS